MKYINQYLDLNVCLHSNWVKVIGIICLISIVGSLNVEAQNGPHLFKLSYEINDSDPDWVKLMYSDNPNIWEVEREHSEYYRKSTFVKTTHTQNYKHWIKTIYRNDYITDEGYIHIPSNAEQKLIRSQKIKQWSSKDQNQKMANWTPMGPFETYWGNDGNVKISSQVNIYSIDQSLSNPNILFAGTETSAVFKSTDKAENWTSVTNGLVLDGGVNTVKVHPNNPNIVLFGTRSEIYKTVNGGATWDLVYQEGNMNPNDILFIPGTNPADPYIIMVTGGSVSAGPGGVYRSTNEGAVNSWNKIYNEAGWDLELKPGSADIVYLLRSNTNSQQVQFYRSSNKGATFTEQNNGWFAGSSTGIDNTNAGARMAVSPSDPDYIYVALLGDDVSRAQDVFWIGVYKSTDGGTTWSLPAGDPGGPYSPTHYNLTHFHPFNIAPGPTPYQQEYYNLGIAMSPTDPEKIMVGCLSLFQSTDGGATYSGIGGYVNDVGYAGYRHPDIQEIEINGNDVWVANDGGIDKYAVDWSTHEAKNLGINGTEYWGFDSGWNEDVLVGGRYHNGNAVLYQDYNNGEARGLGGGEAGTGYVNQGENRKVYMSDAQDRIIPTDITNPLGIAPSLGIYPSEENGNAVRAGEIEPDPRCYNHMYLTRDHQIYKSTDGGVNFTVLHAFGTDANQRATRIEVSRSNPDVIYVAQRLVGSSTIWKTINGGANWNPIPLPPGINTEPGFLISLSPTDENELYIAVANGGNSNEKVYRTSNAGANWTNLTTAMLDGQRPEQILHQGGTNGGVYVATSSSFFYRNNTHTNWQVFTNGAPADFKSGYIRPFYKESKIRIATENRGIWSSPLFESSAPIAQPMASKLSVSCFDETIQFEDYSILDHTNASWNWTFTPAPAFIDDANKRNPKVRFGTAGTYTVTLKVTNGAGQMSTKTINQMITVGNTCFCVPCPGCSTEYTKVGAAVEDIPNCCINLTPNTLFTKGGAWHAERINLSNDVEFKFNLDLGNIDGDDADGAAFVLQKADNTALGQGLGNNDISPSLSVVFKTFGTDRIEIWKDGVDNNLAITSPAINGTGSHAVTVKWDATLKRLTVDWENDGIDITYDNDLIANYFAGDGSNIIWGFTAGTGGLSANHKVCDITLNVTAGPCPPNVTVSADPMGNTLASALITTQGTINANGALFSAPNVNLENGFSVSGNQCFEVNNVGCLYTGTLDCGGGNMNMEDGSCASPYTLTCGQAFNGSTVGGQSNWATYGVDDFETGPERVHSVVVPANTMRTVTLSNYNEDLDLFVLTTCDNASVIDASTSAGATETITINNNSNNPATYFVVVDGYDGVMSTYTLDCN